MLEPNDSSLISLIKLSITVDLIYYVFVLSSALTKATGFGMPKRWQFCLLILTLVAAPVELLKF